MGAPLFLFAAPGHSPVDACTLAVEVAIRPVAAPIEAALYLRGAAVMARVDPVAPAVELRADAVAAPLELVGSRIVSVLAGAVGLAIQARLEAVAFRV